MVSKEMLPRLLAQQLAYSPRRQPFYSFIEGGWRPAQRNVATAQSAPVLFETLHVITWNIDFMAPHPRARMASALDHLEVLVASIPAASAVVVLLQEILEESATLHTGTGPPSNDFTQLREAPWVRERFYMTDLDLSATGGGYGQVTLIDRRLGVARVSRLPFVSEFNRDAVLVDIALGGQGQKVLRLCNVHLDSMQGTLRPVQWKAVQKHLQSTEDGVAASVLAGDCNANAPRDRTEPQENGFKDAYLDLGGREGDEEGATWGFQSRAWKKWGRQRLDKMVYWGDLEAQSLERIGMGVKVEEEEALRELRAWKKLTFVTDHYGLMCEFVVPDGLRGV